MWILVLRLSFCMAAPRMTAREVIREGQRPESGPVGGAATDGPGPHARCHAVRPGLRVLDRRVMSTRHLRLVVDNQSPPNPCSCRTWGLLRSISRDLILYDLMQWAQLLHGVGLTLQARGEHVVISDVMAATPKRGGVRRVMTELCSWADCARVTLELIPSAHLGSGAGHLAALYTSQGFRRNHEQPTLFDMPDSLIRRPVRGRAHVRL